MKIESARKSPSREINIANNAAKVDRRKYFAQLSSCGRNLSATNALGGCVKKPKASNFSDKIGAAIEEPRAFGHVAYAQALLRWLMTRVSSRKSTVFSELGTERN